MKLMKLFVIILTIFCAQTVLAARDSLHFVTEELPPFNYTENNAIVGFFPDVIEAVCIAANISCRIDLQPWLDDEWQVRRGQADAIFAIVQNDKRNEWLTFGPPVAATEYGLFVTANDPFIYQGPQSLRGKAVKIGAYGPSNTFYSLQQLLNTVPDLGVTRFNSTLDAFLALNAGKINAVYSNRESGLTLAAQHQLAVNYAGTVEKFTYHYAFGHKVRKGLIDQFNKTYQQLKIDGKIAMIAKQYGVTIAEPTQGK